MFVQRQRVDWQAKVDYSAVCGREMDSTRDMRPPLFFHAENGVATTGNECSLIAATHLHQRRDSRHESGNPEIPANFFLLLVNFTNRNEWLSSDSPTPPSQRAVDCRAAGDDALYDNRMRAMITACTR